MRPSRTQPQVGQRPILDEDVYAPRKSESGQGEQERHRRVLQRALEAETPCRAGLQVLLLDLLKDLLLHVIVHGHPLSIVKTMVPDTKGIHNADRCAGFASSSFRSLLLARLTMGPTELTATIRISAISL